MTDSSQPDLLTAAGQHGRESLGDIADHLAANAPDEGRYIERARAAVAPWADDELRTSSIGLLCGVIQLSEDGPHENWTYYCDDTDDAFEVLAGLAESAMVTMVLNRL